MEGKKEGYEGKKVIREESLRKKVLDLIGKRGKGTENGTRKGKLLKEKERK